MPLANTLDLVELNAELGAYCRDHKQELKTAPILGMMDHFAAMGIQLTDGVKDQQTFPTMTIGEIVQPADDKNFTPKEGAIKFGANLTQVKGWKVDLQLFPEDFKNTAISMASRKAKGQYIEAEDMPFYAEMMKGINERVARTLRKAFWMAKVAANTDAMSFMNGIVELCKLRVASADIPSIATGAITSANINAKLENIADAFSTEFGESGINIYTNKRVFDLYTRQPESATGRVLNFTDLKQRPKSAGRMIEIPGTSATLMEVVDLPSAVNTVEPLIATVAGNLGAFADSFDEFSSIRTQLQDRYIKVLMDGKFGGEMELTKLNNIAHVMVNDAAIFA